MGRIWHLAYIQRAWPCMLVVFLAIVLHQRFILVPSQIANSAWYLANLHGGTLPAADCVNQQVVCALSGFGMQESSNIVGAVATLAMVDLPRIKASSALHFSPI